MRVILVATLLLSFLSLSWAQCSINTGCTPAKIAQAVTAIQIATNGMKTIEMKPNSHGEEFSAVNTAVMANWNDKILPCMKLVPEVMLLDEGDGGPPMGGATLGSGLIGTVSQQPFNIETRQCEFFNETSPEWKNDPCCNFELNKCCKKHNIQSSKYEVATMNTANLQACCPGSESDVEAYVSFWLKNIRPRKKKCKKQEKNAFKELDRMFQGVGKCFRQLFEEQSCDQDSDCDGDSQCINGNCPRSGREDKNAVAKGFAICLFQLVPKKVKPSIKEKLDVTTDDELYTQMAQQISSGQCIKRAEPWQTLDGDQYNTSAKCEAATECNDGSGGNCANEGQGFCGYGCHGPSCYGKYNLGSVPNKQTCDDIGYCIATNGWLTKSQCEAQSYCTVQSMMNEQNCTSAFLCRKFPFRDPSCLKDGSIGASGQFQCPGGWYEERYIKKCKRWDITTEGACNSAGGTWTMPPSTSQSCLSYKRCVDDNEQERDFNEEECNKCGYTWGSIFQASQGVWQNKKYVQAGQWKNQTNIKKNKWVSSIDMEKINEFLYKVASQMIVPVIVSSSKCDNEPYFQLMETISCACGEVKGQNCFEQEKRSVAEGLKFYRDGSEMQNFGPGSIHPQIYASAFLSVDVLEDIVFPPPSSKRMHSVRGGYATSQVNVVSGTDGTTVGSIVGSGYSSSSASSSNSQQLCISESSDYSKDSTHTVAAFCVKTNNKYYFKTSDVTSDSVDICKTVTSSTTYYPCYVVTGTTDTTGDVSDDDGTSSGADRVAVSSIMVAVLVIVGFFM